MRARDVMTNDLVTCDAQRPLRDAACLMRDHDIGDVLVMKDGEVCGIVTDRDIVVRGLADHGDASSLTLGDVCSKGVYGVSPDSSIEDVLDVMEQHAVRRVPVMEQSQPVGIVSIGDLAVEKDRESALAKISAAAPNN